jgi:hypothetical protein
VTLRTIPRSRLTLFTAVLLVLLPASALAGAWVQDLGKIYAKITYGAASANTIYRFDGELKFPTDNGAQTVRDYPLVDRGLYLYAEYGLTSDLTIVGSAIFRRSIITTPIERRTTEGMGDISLAGKYRLATIGQQVVSGTLGVVLPTGYSRDLAPALGSGNLNIELAGNYGISLHPLPAYATATLGYRIRPSIFLSDLQDTSQTFEPNYANEVFSDLEAGYTFGGHILLHGVARFLFSTRTDDNDFDVNHPPETQQYIKLGGGVILMMDNGLQLSADAFTTPYGRKTANSFDLFLGVAWNGFLFRPGSPAGADPLAPAPDPPGAEPLVK